MNSRERVRLALNHREADRVPIVFGGSSTSIQLNAYRDLVRHLALPGASEKIADMMQCIVDPDARIQERFGNDAESVWAKPARPWERLLESDEDKWVDEWHIIHYRPSGGFWYDFAGHPLEDGSLQELARLPWPDPRDPARTAGLEEIVRPIYDAGEKAIVLFGTTGGIHEQSWYLRGLDALLMDMADQPFYVEALAERLLEWMIEFWDAVLTQVGPYVDVVALADDLGTQSGLIFSPQVYRRIYKPRLRRLIESVHAKTKAKIWFHSCGAIFELIPDLIEAGVEILNPVQVSAKGMDSAVLKREFGKDLVFWGGGCDPQRILPFGSPEQVRAEVKRRIADFAPGGGYVFGPIHNIQAGVPPSNVIAFYEAALEFGNYPVG